MNKGKTAVILAAGMGSRLKDFTNKPKCLINFGTNTSIIERTCNILKKNKFKKIIVVTGFKQKEIKNKLKKKVLYRYFKNYRKTNNLQTLLSIKKELNKEFYCFFADLIFHEKILKKLEKRQDNFCMVVDRSKSLKDTMRIKVRGNNLQDIGGHISPISADGNFIGIAKFSKIGAILLKKYLISEKKNIKDYYTKAIQKLIKDKIKVNYLDNKRLFWNEIDTKKDYKKFKKMIDTGKIKYV